MPTTKETIVTARNDGARVPAVAHPLAEESSEIASNISYRFEYSPHFSPLKFDPEQAYYAAAESVRDILIQVSL